MNTQSSVKILMVDMIVGGKLTEASVSHFQDKFGKNYARVIKRTLENYWCWVPAAKYQPDVVASGPYTAICF